MTISSANLLPQDINLGVGPDGWAVARHARELDNRMPVIYVTGWRSGVIEASLDGHLTPGQLFQGRNFTKELVSRPGWTADHDRFGPNIGHDTGLRAYPGFGSNGHMWSNRGLSPHDHEIANFDRSRDPALRRDRTIPADANIMRDVHEIIEARA